ncbi:MAG: cytochrome P460 family protein, partial [Pseudomonadota bacterium]|nr:cytochrome P460 family protein [Pseudomonadota bacterium]
MKKILLILKGFFLVAMPLSAAEDAPNAIQLPEGYKNWRVIASSHRTDNKTLRVILGNDIAIKAARAGNTRPWPDGSILAKLVWQDKTHEHWEQATVPGDFVHAEFMVKSAEKYSKTGG